MTTNNSTEAIPNPGTFFAYAAVVLRFIASFATFMNICVVLLLIRLKKKFRNYSYWFQILVLASEDLFNGLASLSLTFYDEEIFKTNFIACSTILCAYMCTQINTLLGSSCICVNRFKSIKNIDKLQELNTGYQQEIAVLLAALFSIVYSVLPFLVFKLHTSVMPICNAPTLFGSNIRGFKLLMALGLIIPLVVINVLYGICLIKLRRVNALIRPLGSQSKSDFLTRATITDDTYEGTSTSKENHRHLKRGPTDFQFGRSNMDLHQQKTKIITVAPAPETEECSTSATVEKLPQSGKTNSLIRAHKSDTQSRAVKLLGLILFSTNIATIVPVSLLLRDIIAPEEASGSTSLGLVLLALNSLIDAFIYGVYSLEMRTYIYSKLLYVKRLCCSRS